MRDSGKATDITELQERIDARRRLEVSPPGEPFPNAHRFVEAEFDHAERPLLAYQGGVFYSWNSTCWPELDDDRLRAQLYNWCDDKVYYVETKNGPMQKPFAPTRHKVGDLVDALRAAVYVDVHKSTPSWFGDNGIPADELIACSNGLVHFPSRTLYPHTPSFYGHYSVPFAFNSEAPRPQRWLAFLNELWPNDQESIDTLQELFGYLVAGDTRQQKLFLLVGPKRSGKGTIARILKLMLGAHNVAGPTLASLSTNFGLSPLIGKPVAIVADARLNASDTSVVTERLLSLSGEDLLTVDRKYKEPWNGTLRARVLILSNELPRLSDSSGALASRFIVLTMTNSFYGRENQNLTNELATELPAILNWALDGLERLRQRGRFGQPAASHEAIRELEDLGSPVGAFVRDECVVGAKYEAPCDQLFDHWRAWCEEHGRKPGSSQVFGRNLRAAFPVIRGVRPRATDGTRYRSYQGIGLAVRAGPRTGAMYSQQPPTAADRNYSVTERGPSRTDCTRCDGEGCGWCREVT